MEYNVFRDYCKAENSDDEETNHDLQSRLYAEIYYTSNDVKNVDTKTNVKLETARIDNENSGQIANTCNDTMSNNYNRNHDNTYPANNSVNNFELATMDAKPDVKNICVISNIESLQRDINTKGNTSVPCMKTWEEFDENTDGLRNNKQLTMCENVEPIKSSLYSHRAHNIEKNASVKPEIEEAISVKPEIEKDIHTNPDIGQVSKEQLKSLQQVSIKTAVTPPVQSNSATLLIAKTDSKTYQEATCIKNPVDNILKKYEFSKSFINKLYVEKYENLTKTLEKIQNDKERKLQEREQLEITVSKRHKEDCQQQEFNTNEKPANKVQDNTKYDVVSRIDKPQKTNYSEEITVLTSDSESDSEESILEVPIPPKPQPPLINLQDSDENSDRTNSDSDNTDHDCSFIIEDERNLIKNTKRKASMMEEDDNSESSVLMDISRNDAVKETDIMLNCTEIQKGASNIKEIKQMSKFAQSERHSDNGKRMQGKHMENEIHTTNVNKSNNLQFTNDADDRSELPAKTVSKSNAVYERDKSIDFSEDVDITNLLDSEKETTSRKRHRENIDEPSTSTREDGHSESKRSKINAADVDKSKESWEEYFFRPMSDNLKTFYNESRGQENFDIKEIQSKMSKDPLMWAILDEDLMPDLLKRQRYWNMKCNNCYEHGHQKHNCPAPQKPIRCHMCGAEGHMETRCPQKMCLTCGKKQGTFRKTCEFCRTLYCNTCNAIGHKSTECPDLWRRFHQTTRISEIHIPENLSEVMKPADLLYCCNCTKRGHDSSTCNEYRWSQHFPTPAFVSSYTGGPKYEVPTFANASDEDVIPLSHGKKKKYSIFLPNAEDIDASRLVYSFGQFFTEVSNGEEVKRKLCGEQVQLSNMTGLLRGAVSPTFLDEMYKRIKFAIKIYYDTNNELMMTVRSRATYGRHIFNLFVFWLKLQEDDKHLPIKVDLPPDTKQLCKLFTSKLEEFNKNIQDPRQIIGQINQLKRSVTFGTVQHPTTADSSVKKLLELQANLIKVFHTKPRASVPLKKIKRDIKYLKKHPCVKIPMGQYLNFLVDYNKVFVPRNLTDAELQRFLKQYYKHVNSAQYLQYTEKENNMSKKQKKKKKAYETLIESLVLKYTTKDISGKTNDGEEASTKDTSNNTNNSGATTENVNNVNNSNIAIITKNTYSKTSTSEVDLSRDAKIVENPTISFPIETISTSSNYELDVSVVTQQTETIFTETSNLQNNVIESTNVVYPITRIELPRNDNSANKSEVASTKEPISRTLINIPLVKDSQATKIPKNRPCIKVVPLENLTEKHPKSQIDSNKDNAKEEIQIISDSSLPSPPQQDTTTSSEPTSTKRKKSKKSKKTKRDTENDSGIVEKQTDTEATLEDKTKQIMNEALEFNVPYMKKAVDEIQKKLNEKKLKQEHLNTLQRLIRLEKEHRNYLSLESFIQNVQEKQ